MLDSLALVFLPTLAAGERFGPALLSPPLSPAACLHGPDESGAEAERRRGALGAARMINSMQVEAKWRTGQFLRQSELATTAAIQPVPGFPAFEDKEILPGFELRLVGDDDGYMFTITDRRDPCRFTYVSSEQGAILRADVIR